MNKHAQSAARLGSLMLHRVDAIKAFALQTSEATEYAMHVAPYCIDAPSEMPAGSLQGCTRGAVRFAVQIKLRRV